jgi:hypothetical protein
MFRLGMVRSQSSRMYSLPFSLRVPIFPRLPSPYPAKLWYERSSLSGHIE